MWYLLVVTYPLTAEHLMQLTDSEIPEHAFVTQEYWEAGWPSCGDGRWTFMTASRVGMAVWYTKHNHCTMRKLSNLKSRSTVLSGPVDFQNTVIDIRSFHHLKLFLVWVWTTSGLSTLTSRVETAVQLGAIIFEWHLQNQLLQNECHKISMIEKQASQLG